MEFRVKSGSHREGKKVFQPGDIVKSDRDLEKAFKNKFETVPPGTKVEVAAAQTAEPKADEASPEKKPAPRRSISRRKTDIQV